MEQQLSDNDSYVMVDFENFPKIFSDSDKLSYASDKSSTEVEEAQNSDAGSCWEVNVEEKMLSPITNSIMEINMCLQEPEPEPEPKTETEPDDVSNEYDVVVSVNKIKLNDIVKFEVLPLLPAKLLLKFRSVSRDWDSWISCPFLAHKQSYLHTDLSGFFRQSTKINYPDDINFIGFDSCCGGGGGGIPTPFLEFLPQATSLINATHGLLLCRGSSWENQHLYYVCNPLTTKYRQLPQSNYFHERESAILVFEPSVLNFDAEYKVVAAHSIMDQPLVFFEIYCSKENAWRCSETICSELEEDNVLFVECFYMKGHVYWQTSSGSIVGFDLKTEHCGVMSLPAAAHFKKGVLAELQGELSYIQVCEPYQFADSTSITLDIYQGWNFGVMNSVEVPIGRDRRTRMREGNYCRVLQSVQGEILMILCEDRVYSYHLRTREVVIMNRDVGNKWKAKYLTYVNSLVTIDP